MNKKIGLLLSRSVIYPSIAFDMMDGLRSNLENIGRNDIEIKTESIGLAADDKLIYTACEKLLLEGCSIVTGYLNPTTAEMLAPLFTSAGALLIVLDAGYHFPSSIKQQQQHIFYLSLQGALCCRTAAKIAMDDGMKDVAFTCSFYDSGYRSPFAFHQGVNEGNGTITFNHITQLKRSEFTLEPLAAHLKETKVDAVFASFCGDMLQDFFGAAAQGNIFKNHAVYGSSFMGEEQWLEQSLYPGTDIKVCVPWITGLNNAANLHFEEQLKKKNKKANIFSLLGWEVTSMIAETIATENIHDAIKKLEGFAFLSPRGEITIDTDTHQSKAPIYEALVVKNEVSGNCLLKLEGISAHTKEQRAKLETEINAITGPMTSWFNAYACLDS
jgi:branched-chain amino acid transport system substrate-binding protein